MLKRAASFLIAIAFIVPSLCLIVSPAVATTPSFSSAVRVNQPSTSGNQLYPRLVAASDLNLTAVFADYSFQRYKVSSDSSFNGGASWLNKLTIDSNNNVVLPGPSIAKNSTGTLFCVFSDDRYSTQRIFISNSTDNGQHWSSNELITTGAQGNQTRPDVTVSNDIVYIVYSEFIPDKDPDIFLVTSNNSGHNFTAPVRVDHTGSSLAVSLAPVIIVHDDRVLVAWEDSRQDTFFDIYCSVSNDGGRTFVSDIKVSDAVGDSEQILPSAAFLQNGSALIVWQDKRTNNLDIRGAITSSFLSFSPSFVASDDLGSADQTSPRVKVDGRGIVHLVYTDSKYGPARISYVSSYSGISYSSAVRVSEPVVSAQQDHPDLDISPNGTVMIVFEQTQSLNTDIYFTKLANLPPLCAIKSPAAGTEVVGNFTVTGNASDPDAPDPLHSPSLDVQVALLNRDDGNATAWLQVNLSGQSNWTISFNSTLLENGNYTILARSFDGATYSEIQRVEVVINNIIPQYLDLFVTSDNLYFDKPSPFAGQVIRVSADIFNRGNTDATGVQVRFTADGALVESLITVPIVPAGGSATVGVNWTAVQGAHLINVTADPTNLINETNESNNTASRSLSVAPAPILQPDLAIAAANITLTPSSIFVGQRVNISVLVFNHGEVPANNVNVRFALTNPTLTVNRTVGFIQPQNGVLLNITWNATVGTHALTITADPQHLINDKNYDDNAAAVEFTVQPASVLRPDLYVGTVLVAPNNLIAGQNASISVIIGNSGNAPANNVVVSFFVDGDRLANRTVSVDVGQSTDTSAVWPSVAGQHLILVKVDEANLTNDANLTNNSASTSVSVTPASTARAELDVSLANMTAFPNPPVDGRILYLNFTVRNLGNRDASNVQVQVLKDEVQFGDLHQVGSISAGGLAVVSASWLPEKGVHKFTVIVDPDHLINESRRTNNELNYTVDMGAAPLLPSDFDPMIFVVLVGSFAFLAVAVVYFLRKRSQRKK